MGERNSDLHPEDQTTEYKSSYTPDVKKEVAAFANSQGGTITIGIDDHGNVLGTTDTDGVMAQAANAIRDGIRPDVTMFVDLTAVSVEGKRCVCINVQRGASRPYYLSDKGMKPGGVYVRQGCTSAPASEEAIHRMIVETDGTAYESMRSTEQSLTFVYTSAEMEKRSVVFGAAQFRTLGLVDENGLFTNLALLLSDQCPHTIKAAYFEGTRKTEFKDRQEFSGSLLKQLSDCYGYIDLLNKTRSTFAGLDRIDERDYPLEAIREALLNCIVHREYSFSGSILISIFEDRIEMVSLGGLVAGLTKDAILIGVSQPRNRHLADVFYRMRLIEAYGTGIGKIFASYEAYPFHPSIDVVDGAFRVVLPNIHCALHKQAAADVTKQQQAVLDLFESKSAIQRPDVERLLGVKQSRALVILKEMIKSGLLRQLGEGKDTRYVLK